MERAVHEVWARVAWAAVDTAARGGLALDGVFEGLPFDQASLRGMSRVAWADYCTMVERIEVLAGSPEAFRKLYEAEYHQSFSEVRAAVSSVISPKILCRSACLATVVLFPPLVMECFDEGTDRLRVEVRLRVGARPCLVFFRGTIGTMAGLPRHLGLPSAEVDADVSDHHGTYRLLLPHSRTVFARRRRRKPPPPPHFAPRFVLGVDGDGRPMTTTVGDPRASGIPERLEAAADAWDLTRRQSDVLGVLARGRSNKEIAVELGCAENTVELHVSELLRRTGASSRSELIARFWSEL